MSIGKNPETKLNQPLMFDERLDKRSKMLLWNKRKKTELKFDFELSLV